MTNLPPDSDLPPEDPPYFEQEETQRNSEGISQEHAFQNFEPERESSGFGFVALVAGLICLVAFSGIVIYSLLLAPSPPRQPILIEVEGTTKQAPAKAQVKPEPNRNVGVFRMLRGTDAPQQNATKQNTTEQNTAKNTSIIAKPGATPDSDTNGKSETLNEGNAETSKESVLTESSEKPSTKETPKETPSVTPTTQAVKQETASASTATTSKSGRWYVQIAALESRAAADKAWGKLHDQLPELLYTQNYVVKEATLASGKRVWRLLLGPQPQPQAETLCRELKTRARSCLVKKLAR